MDNNTSFVVYWKTMGFRNISSVLKKSRVTVCLLVVRFYTRGGASATWECKLRFSPRMQFSVSILKFGFHVDSFKFDIYLFLESLQAKARSYVWWGHWMCILRGIEFRFDFWVNYLWIRMAWTRNGSIFGHKLLRFFTKYSYNARMLEVGGNRSVSCEE